MFQLKEINQMTPGMGVECWSSNVKEFDHYSFHLVSPSSWVILQTNQLFTANQGAMPTLLSTPPLGGILGIKAKHP